MYSGLRSLEDLVLVGRLHSRQCTWKGLGGGELLTSRGLKQEEGDAPFWVCLVVTSSDQPPAGAGPPSPQDCIHLQKLASGHAGLSGTVSVYAVMGNS